MVQTRKYSDYLKQYEKKVKPLRDKRIREAKEARQARIKAKIDIRFVTADKRAWVSPRNPRKGL